jgi:hypothetical protein
MYNSWRSYWCIWSGLKGWFIIVSYALAFGPTCGSIRTGLLTSHGDAFRFKSFIILVTLKIVGPIASTLEVLLNPPPICPYFCWAPQIWSWPITIQALQSNLSSFFVYALILLLCHCIKTCRVSSSSNNGSSPLATLDDSLVGYYWSCPPSQYHHHHHHHSTPILNFIFLHMFQCSYGRRGN